MIRRIQIFLGPTYSRMLIVWVAITGLSSLVLNVVVNQYTWVRLVQSLIVVAFLLGLVIIFFIRLSSEERGHWAAILVPSLLAILIGLAVVPQLALLFMGGALGWIIAMLLITRNRMPVEYRQAVKFLRKSEYAEAIKIMDKVIHLATSSQSAPQPAPVKPIGPAPAMEETGSAARTAKGRRAQQGRVRGPRQGPARRAQRPGPRGRG